MWPKQTRIRYYYIIQNLGPLVEAHGQKLYAFSFFLANPNACGGGGGGTTTTAAPTPGCNASKNDKNCCKSSNPCSIGEGDCDKDSHCAGSLVCGKNNCKQFNNAWSDASFDCCEDAPTPGCNASKNDKNCCKSSNPCSIGEGDCDKDSHCAGNLVCGKNNCKQFDNAWSDASFDCCEEANQEGM